MTEDRWKKWNLKRPICPLFSVLCRLFTETRHLKPETELFRIAAVMRRNPKPQLGKQKVEENHFGDRRLQKRKEHICFANSREDTWG